VEGQRAVQGVEACPDRHLNLAEEGEVRVEGQLPRQLDLEAQEARPDRPLDAVGGFHALGRVHPGGNPRSDPASA